MSIVIAADFYQLCGAGRECLVSKHLYCTPDVYLSVDDDVKTLEWWTPPEEERCGGDLWG